MNNMAMNNNMGMNNNMNNMNMNNMNNMGMNNMGMSINNMNNNMNVMSMNALMSNMMNLINNINNMNINANNYINQQQNNITNSDINNNTNESNEMSIVFQRNKKDSKKNFKITIYCKDDEKLFDVTERYLHKVAEERKKILFLYNAKAFKGGDFQKTIKDLTILPGSTIFAVDIDLMVGGS